jgi:dynein heavy chain, axonemal
VPRKVAINRKKKEYASFVIEELLLHLGIDYNKRQPHVEWLPLELFDDTVFDDYEKEDWIKKFKDEKINYHALTGKVWYIQYNRGDSTIKGDLNLIA